MFRFTDDAVQIDGKFMKRNGSVLVITLWVLTLLVLFALGLGHRAAISLRITKNQRDRLIAASVARSGVQYAVAILNNDFLDTETTFFDSLASCGVNLKGRSTEEVFTKIWNGEKSSFKIGYTVSPDISGYGCTDEERRININGLTGIDENILVTQLLKIKNVPDAEDLASWVSAWVANNKQLVVPEELQSIFAYYYVTRNTAPEEARRKARDAYVNIQDYITVFGDNKLNINTVSFDVLRVLSRAIALVNGKNAGKADALAGDILDARNQRVFTNLDALSNAYTGSDVDEKEIFAVLKNYLCIASNFFRIESLADVEGAKKSLTVIYDRKQKSIVYRYEI